MMMVLLIAWKRKGPFSIVCGTVGQAVCIPQKAIINIKCDLFEIVTSLLFVDPSTSVFVLNRELG